jgi:hypothetical protein
MKQHMVDLLQQLPAKIGWALSRIPFPVIVGLGLLFAVYVFFIVLQNLRLSRKPGLVLLIPYIPSFRRLTLGSGEPRTVWSLIPYIGSGIAFGRNPVKFIWNKAGKDGIFTCFLQGHRTTIVVDPHAYSGVLRFKDSLSFDEVMTEFSTNIFQVRFSLSADRMSVRSKVPHSWVQISASGFKKLDLDISHKVIVQELSGAEGVTSLTTVRHTSRPLALHSASIH